MMIETRLTVLIWTVDADIVLTAVALGLLLCVAGKAGDDDRHRTELASLSALGH